MCVISPVKWLVATLGYQAIIESMCCESDLDLVRGCLLLDQTGPTEGDLHGIGQDGLYTVHREREFLEN